MMLAFRSTGQSCRFRNKNGVEVSRLIRIVVCMSLPEHSRLIQSAERNPFSPSAMF